MRAADLFPGARIPRPLTLTRQPTPLELHDQASADLGLDLTVKRDDLLDDSGCGHKARKLEYVLAHARSEGSTVLVTAASLPSSQAVGLALHAPRHGMRVHIVYCGDEQERPPYAYGNYLLVQLLGATSTWFERHPWDGWPQLVAEVMASERERGERPYLAPPGLSEWPGLAGSIDLGLELAHQIPADDQPLHVIATAGSGGTCLGLAIGAHRMGRAWTVHGVGVGGMVGGVRASIRRLRRQAEAELGPLALPDEPVLLFDAAGGARYDAPRPEELETIRDAFRHYGLLLDPTYMARTFTGLRRMAEVRVVPPGARTVLVHTGGSFGVFNEHPALRRWLDG